MNNEDDFEGIFGTPPRKLYRRGDPDTSKGAAEGVDSTRLEAMVYRAIKGFGRPGCISDEVRALPEFRGFPYSSVTARYAALIEKRLVFDSGMRRRGKSGRSMRVMVASDYASPSDFPATIKPSPTTPKASAQMRLL